MFTIRVFPSLGHDVDIPTFRKSRKVGHPRLWLFHPSKTAKAGHPQSTTLVK